MLLLTSVCLSLSPPAHFPFRLPLSCEGLEVWTKVQLRPAWKIFGSDLFDVYVVGAANVNVCVEDEAAQKLLVGSSPGLDFCIVVVVVVPCFHCCERSAREQGVRD